MSKLTVITNRVPRRLVSFAELPPKLQKDFDYVENYDSSYRFVQYKGVWYDVYDSMTTRSLRTPSEAANWESYIPETFFSGVVFRYVDDERVIVGRYFA